MKVYLSRSDRSKILKSLSKKQQDALFTAISMTYKSEFGNLLAKFKGTKQWDFYRYIDHGKVISSAKCECGRPLRYEFILKNKKTKKLMSLGSTHFQEELQIPEDIAKEVIKSIHNIDYDLDEILTKVKSKWSLNVYLDKAIKRKKIIVPVEIKILLDAKLPILDRHENKLWDMNREYDSINEILPNVSEDMKLYLKKVIIPLVDSQEGARYIIVKPSSIPFELLTEINFPRGYYAGDDLYNRIRYRQEYFQVDWKYHSSRAPFLSRKGNFGPKMCIAKIDLFSKKFCGLLVLCGMRSIEELKKEVSEFLLKNKLKIEKQDNSIEKSPENYKEYYKLIGKYRGQIDYLKLHEYQIEIGKLGEAYVYDLEREKLMDTPFFNQVDKSKALDSNNGYDISSFEKDGTPIYIEVKTSVNIDEEFYLSNNELKVAKQMKEKGKKYVIYRVENILAESVNDIKVKKIYDLVDNKEINLEPTNWKVTLN